mgnify:FL=1
MENKPDLIATIEREGFSVKQKGRALWLSCPFHEDKTPSFKINPEKQTFYCFSCNSGGDSITFVEKLHGLSFKDALKYLNLEGNQLVKIKPKERTKRDLLNDFRSWEREYLRQITDIYRVFHDILRHCTTMDEIEEYSEDFQFMNLIEHHWKILFYGTDEEKYELYKGVNANGKI